MVHNIHRQCTAEASLAAACLLPFIGDYANLLLRPGMLQALVEAVLLESLEPDPEAAGQLPHSRHSVSCSMGSENGQGCCLQ